jgi:hypothetical protein
MGRRATDKVSIVLSKKTSDSVGSIGNRRRLGGILSAGTAWEVTSDQVVISTGFRGSCLLLRLV